MVAPCSHPALEYGPPEESQTQARSVLMSYRLEARGLGKVFHWVWLPGGCKLCLACLGSGEKQADFASGP